MIKRAKIKELAKKQGKKLSEKAEAEIDKLLEKNAEEIVKRASRKASFSGRKIIMKEDLED